MDAYPFALIVHIFAAVMFVGTVFFEVLILEGVRKKVSPRFMEALEGAIGRQARKIMPFVMLFLFGSGITMVWLRYQEFFLHPLTYSFGLLLDIKITLAVVVLCHFFTAMFLISTGRMKSIYFKRIHLSVFVHVVLIVLLAKAMFFWTW